MSAVSYLNNFWITVTGFFAFYFGRIYNLFLWRARVTKQDVDILVANHRGIHIKYEEDRIDPINPSVDGGLLFSFRWFCSYSMINAGSSKAEIASLLGGSSSSYSSEYTVTSLRLFRNRLLRLMEVSKRLAEAAKPKIYIVDTGSVLFAGDAEEEHLTIPPEIESQLDGKRDRRLNILLHGPIGSGKTTIARAIACKIRQSIYILSINSWWSLTDYIRALQRIPDNAIILFDDFETTLRQVLKAQIGSDGSMIPLKFSTAALMAMLDGILFKSRKWIVVMITNEPDWVKKVLRLRPGRVHVEYRCTEEHKGGFRFCESRWIFDWTCS